MDKNFLITYDESGVYRFFSEDEVSYTLTLSNVFGTRVVPRDEFITEILIDEDTTEQIDLTGLQVKEIVSVWLRKNEEEEFREFTNYNYDSNTHIISFTSLLEISDMLRLAYVETKDFYARDVTDTNLKTETFDLQNTETGENPKTFVLDTEENVFSYDESQSIVISEDNVINSEFHVEGGQASVIIAAPVPDQFRVQLSYYGSGTLVENNTYNLTIKRDNEQAETIELICGFKNDTWYLGDYDFFLSTETSVTPESEIITVGDSLKTTINEYVIYSVDKENQYEIDFQKNESTSQKFNLYSKELVNFIEEDEGETYDYGAAAYVGNLYLYTKVESDRTEEPFLIVTGSKDETYKSYFYVEETGSYTLNVKLNDLGDVPELVGAALVSFGNKFYNQDKGAYDIKNGYGIGINSGDSKLTLPPRAISLFETQLGSTESQNKISFKYRGILGTLPEMRYVHEGETDPQVAKLYRDYMEGRQGIYTDNMYIGDAKQYLAFYTDGNDKKRLDVTGGIHALSLTIGEGNDEYNGIDAINISGYSLTITIEENSGLGANEVYLYPHLYHNGIEQLPETGKEEEFYNSFKWYENGVLLIDPADPNNGGRIIANRENKYRLTYSFADGATEGAQPIQPIYVEPTEYITDIDRNGIKIHPKQWTTDSNYLQLDGNGLYINNSEDTTLAQFTSNETRIGQDKTWESQMVLSNNMLKLFTKDTPEQIIMGVAPRLKQWTDFLVPSRTINNGESSNLSVGIKSGVHVDFYMDYEIGGNDSVIRGKFINGFTTVDDNGVKMSVIVASNLVQGCYGVKIENNTGEQITITHFGGQGFAENGTHISVGVDNTTYGYSITNGENNSGYPYSNLSGYGLVGHELAQTIIGFYNKVPRIGRGKVFIIGNGTDEDNRSNAFTVDWDGRVECGDNQGTLTALLDLIHPVGSYYWTSDGDFAPADVFGGTWEKIDAGVTLVSAGTGYTVTSGTAKDGGSKDSIIPYHRHSVGEQNTGNMSANSSHNHDFTYGLYQRAATSDTNYAVTFDKTDKTETTENKSVQHTHKVPSHNTDYEGTSRTGANMPPYKCAYCWHRTA